MHTPGPWKVSSDGPHITVRGEGYPVAEMWLSDGKHKANARLIAAAPELLDALEWMREEFARLPHSLGYSFTHLPKIDALVAKIRTDSHEASNK